MEDTSKALLIAGAIILILVLISIATFIVFNGEELMNKTGDIAINNAKVSNQVNKFRKYEGKLTGVQVKECISAAIAHNSNLKGGEINYAIRINIGGTGMTTDPYTGLAKIDVGTDYVIRSVDGGRQSVVEQISDNIKNEYKYKGQVHYMENVGTIDAILFNKIGP